MFKKILIAEDHEIRNLGVIKTLEELGIQNYDFASYCDDAYEKLLRAESENAAFDLLITDLSFDKDYREQEISCGQELIAEIRKSNPNLKIIVFSIEKKPSIIDELFKKHHINGFVSKGRNDSRELKNTIKKVYENKTAIPQEIINAIRNNSYEFTNYDISLIELLAKGWRQQEIQDFFKSKNIQPDSRSSIEKRLSELRDSLDAKNNTEMVVLCKDLGII